MPIANVYKPVFNQIDPSLNNVKTIPQSELDTTVLIRSNLKDEVYTYRDSVIVDEDFYFRRAELAVPLELINEKPPTYDTFLLVQNYLFTAQLVDLLFPPKVDSLALLQADSVLLAESDTLVVPDQKPGDDDQLFIDKVKTFFGRIVNKNAKKNTHDSVDKIESKTNDTADYMPVDSVEIIKKEFYTIDEIKADTVRDLFLADTIIQAIIDDVPWKKGDSIPYYSGMNNMFRDSTLKLIADTVYVEVFDSSKIIPQLSYTELCNEFIDTVRVVDYFIVESQLLFKRFYADKVDLFIEMVRVQGGDFKIGSNDYDLDERPSYPVSVSSFLISKFEVTNYMFIVFLNDIECDEYGYDDRGLRIIDLKHPQTKITRKNNGKFEVKDGYDDYPVINVTWFGADQFCNTSRGRLATEAEWEYAARGGVYAHKRYLGSELKDYEYQYRYAGADYLNNFGWFVDNSRGQLWVGGRRLPNELGIYDMSGNVWEWCYDVYSKTFYRANNRSRNPMNTGGSDKRVVRGGAWSNDAVYCRVTNRNYLNDSECNEFTGFRIVIPSE